jgi:hypothetical protein
MTEFTGTELTGTLKAAAFHGIALNEHWPAAYRLQFALAALEIYETEWERINDEAQDSVGDSR